MISCVLLAAGYSRRFGSPKALALIDDETVLHRLQTMLIKTRVDEVIIVLGANAEAIKPHLLNHTRVKFVYNKDYNLGQTSSFKAGLRSVSPQTQGVFLLPVDLPLLQPGTVDALVGHFLKHSPLLVIPTFQGKKGHPPLFSVSLKQEFLDLDDHNGVNTVIHAHQKETTLFPVEDAGVVSSFNTPEELALICRSR